MRKPALFAATIAGLLFASTSVTQAAQPSKAAGATRSAAAVITNGSWPVYHHDNAHTGFDSTLPAASGATTGWVSSTFDEQVYASPVVYQGVVYVATLNNTVYALNQADGSTLWSKHLGAPETSGWVCGNISPQGILGTPVIDPTGNRIYVAAFMASDVWTIFGLDLGANGNTVLQTTIPGNFAGGSFDWKIQGERGALAVANGYVYVPFGGRAGDCNDGSILYQGWVFGIPTSGSTTLAEWNNGGSGGAGMWAPGGVVVDNTTGKVFVTTGNGGCPNSYDNYNDAVIRLSASLALEDYFAPTDWHDNWNCNDQDLGSAGTVLISPTLAFQAGKWGSGFLLNPKSLGGVGGQRYPTPKPAAYVEQNVCRGNTSGANFGSYAYAAPYVYLSCESNGMVALKVNTAAPSFSGCGSSCAAPSWNSGAGKVYGAPIVAGGIVWAVDTNGSGLTGFNAANGSSVFQSAGFGAHRFSTPAEAGGQIFVSSDDVVREFNIVRACSGATLTPSPGSPQTAGTPVTLTAGVGACPSPLYKFWVQPPGGSWGVVQPYGASNVYNWTSDSVVGIYHLEVDIKNSGSTAAYDSVANVTYTITGTAACARAVLTASPPSPGGTGVAVTMNGTSASCPNPRYRFWVKDPGRRWSIVQDYSAATSHLWSQTGLAGLYALEVDVRDASESVVYDVVSNLTYVVNGCSAAGLSANPASPHAHGTTIILTGTSTCPGTATYRFWVRASGGIWKVVQNYGTGNTFSWVPATAGTYYLEVDVRDQNASASYEKVFNITYQAT